MNLRNTMRLHHLIWDSNPMSVKDKGRIALEHFPKEILFNCAFCQFCDENYPVLVNQRVSVSTIRTIPTGDCSLVCPVDWSTDFNHDFRKKYLKSKGDDLPRTYMESLNERQYTDNMGYYALLDACSSENKKGSYLVKTHCETKGTLYTVWKDLTYDLNALKHQKTGEEAEVESMILGKTNRKNLVEEFKKVCKKISNLPIRKKYLSQLSQEDFYAVSGFTNTATAQIYSWIKSDPRIKSLIEKSYPDTSAVISTIGLTQLARGFFSNVESVFKMVDFDDLLLTIQHEINEGEI